MTGVQQGGDCGGGMIATRMPGCMPPSDHEVVAAKAKSFSGQYLRPLLERASTKPVVPAKAGTQPDLIAAK